MKGLDQGRDKAEFAAKYIPQVQLDVLQGPVHDEIFGNECDQIGRDNYPEACVDAPGVNRPELHEYIGAAALRFFGSSRSDGIADCNLQRERLPRRRTFRNSKDEDGENL
jgi:hypothetical protein